MKNSISYIYCVLVLVVFTGCEKKGAEPYINVEAPGFELASLEGDTVALDELQGNPTVIHFGTSWCPFCRAEDPHLQALFEHYQDKGVNVLVINVKEADEAALKWHEEAGFSIPMLMDRSGEVAASYAPEGAQPDLPRADVMIASNLLIDQHGVVRFFSLLDTDSFDAKLVELTKRLDELLSEEA